MLTKLYETEEHATGVCIQADWHNRSRMLGCSIVVLGRFDSSKLFPLPAMLVGSSSVCVTNPSSSGFVSSEPMKSKDWPCGDPNGPFKIKSFPAFLFHLTRFPVFQVLCLQGQEIIFKFNKTILLTQLDLRSHGLQIH
ncbi:hypothetical protein C1H46_029415 [Malus baccata]|uniref:Uncharacterized protein n=1 Tax=Malus baccata TaxID=106549 RepID=A0A540LEZ4_MALBA|nr:hypothetical protein C1H46_029415 [Malus baccata]